MKEFIVKKNFDFLNWVDYCKIKIRNRSRNEVNIDDAAIV